MFTKTTDYVEGGKRIMSFLSDNDVSYLVLKVESDNKGYSIFKFPFSSDIYALYIMQRNDDNPWPGFDFNYACFYSRVHKKIYDVRDSIRFFFRREENAITHDDMKEVVKRAIQAAVAKHIECHSDEFSVASREIHDSAVAEAEIAFSLKSSTLDFANRITVNDWDVSGRDLFNFIVNPDALLKEKVQERISGHKEELSRLWMAHNAAKIILDNLNAAYPGGEDMTQIGKPVTYEQAMSCLNVQCDDKVHSITLLPPSITMGADLEPQRYKQIVERAASEKRLFLSDRLNHLQHNIVAFDWKSNDWYYLDCDEEKVDRLRTLLAVEN